MCSKSVILFILVFQVRNSVPNTCDETKLTTPAGNLGQAGAFPWLGVIRVHLHEGAKLRVALTGAILIKSTYAIAVADDIARIPKNVFQSDSRAMFIASNNQPTLCGLTDYMLHPEYQDAPYNTIALIELDEDLEDEKHLLEKEIHIMQYIDQSLCNKYYYMAGLYDVRYTTKHVLCGQAVDESYSCEWDNGMVLASNASGPWVLLGLGIRGPGCGAPSRFIEIYQYLQWIEASTTDSEQAELGKSAFGTGFEQLRTNKKHRIKDIPVHKFFRARDGADADGKEIGRQLGSDQTQSKDWFHDLYMEEHYKEYDIERLDKNAISIQRFKKGQYEKEEGDCQSLSKNLVYTETMKIYSQTTGIASYKLSLMDILVDDYTCVVIRLEPNNNFTRLWFNDSMIVDEPLGMFDRTPDFPIKHYPIHKEDLSTAKTPPDKEWKPNKNLEPHYVRDEAGTFKNHSNVNLFIKVRFDNEAYIKLEVYGRNIGVPRITPKPKTHRNRTTTESTDTATPIITTTTPAGRRFRFKSRNEKKSARRNVRQEQPIQIQMRATRSRGIVESRTNHDLVHTGALCFLAFLNLMF